MEKKLAVVACACHLRDGENLKIRIPVQARLGKNKTLSPK
jgi:hypothetical protein